MAYGRRTTLRRGAGIGSRNRVSYRKRRPSTGKIYRRLKKAPVRNTKYTAAKNTVAIRSLKTVVNQGQPQRNMHFLNVVTTDGDITPTTNVFMALNDFYHKTTSNINGGLCFQNNFVGGGGVNTPTAVLFGNWETMTPGFQMGLPAEFRQWTSPNLHAPSFEGFMPVAAKYTFNFRFETIASTQPDMYIRLDIIKPKRYYIATSRQRFVLPECGGSLCNMATSPFSQARNAYNPELWHVKTTWIKIPRSDVPRSKVEVSKDIKVSFPKRRINLNLQDLGPTTREAFWQNCPPKDQIWLNINISHRPELGTTVPTIQGRRQIVFRDPTGNTG